MTHDIRDTANIDIPCWLQSPKSSQPQLGFIGTAAPNSVSKNGSEIASQKKALYKLAKYHQLPLTADDLNLINGSNRTVTTHSGKIIHFSTPFRTPDTLYSYASLNKINERQCEVKQCNFKRCSPNWLCKSQTNHVVGVSYFTSYPHKQLATSESNAQIIVGYLEQAQVNVQEQLNETVINTGDKQTHSAYFSQQGSVNAIASNRSLVMTESCFYESTLFAQYQLNTHEKAPSSEIPWRDIRQFKNKSVVLGNFGEDGKIAADNLLSSAIEYAIEDALIELAKIKGIQINSQSKMVQNQGTYMLTNTQFTINEIVKGKLVDIQVSYKDDFPLVYVWLLES